MAGQLQTNKIGAPRNDLGIERVEDELLILDKRNQKVHQLNTVASAIWTSISAGEEAKSIVRNIVESYDVSPVAAARDVAQVVDELYALDLLEKPVMQFNN